MSQTNESEQSSTETFAKADRFLVYVPNAMLDCPVFERKTIEEVNAVVEEYRNYGLDVFVFEKIETHKAIYDKS